MSKRTAAGPLGRTGEPSAVCRGSCAVYRSRVPDDGLDDNGRKMLATQVGGIFTAVGGCAVAWVFDV